MSTPKGAIEEALGFDVPDAGEPLPADTGRGQLKLTDVDRKLAGWRCVNQLEIEDTADSSTD